MFSFFSKKMPENKAKKLTAMYKKIREKYDLKSISEERKFYLHSLIQENGYLPYSYLQALEELSEAEVLYCLEIKWHLNRIFANDEFEFENNLISPVERANIKNSDWIKREQHDIKLINLAALGDGNKSHETANFIDWLRQIVILPNGNEKLGILSTTIYLIPFHPREFGCAYLPTSSDVSELLEDKKLIGLGIKGKQQIQLFINFAQLAGHPVIYDVLPQTSRYSKMVLSSPYIARWFDVNKLINDISSEVDKIADKLKTKFDEDDVEIIKTIYKNNLKSGSSDLSDNFKELYEQLDKELEEIKKELSENMMKKAEQIKLYKRVKEIVANIIGVKPDKITKEDDITKQCEIIQELIRQGLWSAPGGAWCSSGVPIFQKMSECGSYPIFKHYNYKGEDVTHFANLDCQTPFYFVYLDLNEFNMPVIDYFVKYLEQLQADYNFDGFRIDHIDHIVDDFSEKDGYPISYRIPRNVLRKVNNTLKEKNKHFAILAEYMLGGNYLKEYHENMNFDILWGNDIIAQYEKTPSKIIEDNRNLQDYNSIEHEKNNLSVLKTYNNQDGEFRAIDQYPGQLGEKGALFKWFKFKFLPGGKNAQRPCMYVDGDESFTKTGIESTIGSEISLARNNNYEFYNEFNAIRNLAIHSEILADGEAEIITNHKDGFISWMVSKDPIKESFLVVANYNNPTEKISIQKENGEMETIMKNGEIVYNKKIDLPGDYKVISEYKYNFEKAKFEEIKNNDNIQTLTFEELQPSEYKVYKITR